MHIDLGCGEKKQAGAIGVDFVAQPGVDHVCQIGFEPLPFEDSVADLVTACDFLEHIPKIATSKENGKWEFFYPHVFLFNDIWRVLKPNGIFESLTPCFGNGVHGRFVHVSQWNEETFMQVTQLGDDFNRGHMKAYGFHGQFRMKMCQRAGAEHLRVVLQAVK